MRKRQWKKILSMVLALAMVFTMNTSVFAEPVSGDAAEPAVVEPADPAPAEQPAATEPTEPTEPAADTQGEQPSEPVAEPTTNEPATDPVEQPENNDAAPAPVQGGTETKNGEALPGTVTVDGGTIDVDYEYSSASKKLTALTATPLTVTIKAGADSDLTDVANAAAGTVATNVTIVADSGLATAVPITITSDTSGGGSLSAKVGADTVLLDGSNALKKTSETALAAGSYKVYSDKVALGTASAVTNASLINIAGGKFADNKKFYSATAEVTFEEVEAAATTEKSYYVVDTNTHAIDFVKLPAKAQEPKLTSASIDSAATTTTSITIKPTGANKQKFNVYTQNPVAFVKTVDSTDTQTVIGGLKRDTFYQIEATTVSTATAFATKVSEKSDGIKTTEIDNVDPTADVTVDSDSRFNRTAGTMTVSGYEITGSDIMGTIIRGTDGVFTVTVSSGQATVKVETALLQKAISLNAVEKGNIIIADKNGQPMDASKMTLKGTNLISFNEAGDSDPIFGNNEFAKIEKGVKLSANTAGAILVSENEAKRYAGVVYGKDQSVNVSNENKVKIFAIAAEDTLSTVIEEFPAVNEVQIKSTIYTISNNLGAEKTVNASYIDLEKAGSGDAIYWGNTVFYSANKNMSGIKFKVLGKRNVNEINSLTFFNGDTGEKQAKISVFDPVSITGSYIYSVSTVDAAPAYRNDTPALINYVAANTGNILNGDHLAAGETELKPGTTYYVFAIRIDGGYYSAPVKVGSFITKGERKLQVEWNGSTIYYGAQDSDLHNILGKQISFKMDGYTIENYNNKDDQRYILQVKDPANKNLVVGYIQAVVIKKLDYDSAKAAINGAKTKSALDTVLTGATITPAAIVAPTDETTIGTYTINNLVSANGYFLKTFYHPVVTTSAYDGDVSGNLISFNVVPAPVKINAQPVMAPVNTYLKNGVVKPDYPDKVTTRLTFTNTVTGKDEPIADTGDTNFDTSKIIYTTSGKRMEESTSTVSYASAGVQSYSISAGSIKPEKVKENEAKYTIAELVNGKLSIFGKVDTNSFAVTNADVFYGENVDTIKSNMKVTYNNGAEAAREVKKYTVKFYKKEAISANGKSISNSNASMVIADPSNSDAGTEMYAEVTVAASEIAGQDAKETKAVSKLITIKKRPVKIVINDAAALTDKFSSNRNIEIKNTVSGGKTAGESTTWIYTSGNDIGVKDGEKHDYRGAGYPAPKLVDALSENATFDMSFVNVTKANTYEVPVNGVVLKTDVAKNFEVKSATGKYTIKPAYYAYFILEYGGHEGNVRKDKKTVYATSQYFKEAPLKLTWKFPKELEKGKAVSFNGAITDGKDKVISFVPKDYKGNTVGGAGTTVPVATFDGAGYDTTKLEDIYFYAKVRAYATEDVYIESIEPVDYDGNKYILNTMKRTNGTNDDINLVVSDNSKARELVYGTDYTASVKNNVNASVKYDTSQSASNNMSDRGAVTQLFKENKRPQVVITGKGDYKGLKATVYFDILPKNLANITDADAGQLKVKGVVNDPVTGKLDEARSYNHLKLGKKGGVTYKYKAVDNLDLYVAKDGSTKKKVVNLGSKDYDEVLIKTNDQYPKNATTFKVLGAGAKEAKAAAKAITAPDKNYAVRLEGKGNYYGTITYPVKVVGNDVMLLSELAWKTKKVSYKAAGVSSDSAKGNFNVSTSKKINKKKLVYGTDYTATIAPKSDSAKMGEGKASNLALYAGTYSVTIVPGASLKAQAEGGKLILDEAVVDATIKNKKLSKSMFTVTPAKSKYSGKNIDSIKITPKKSGIVEGKQYAALPGTIYTDSGVWNAAKAKAELGDDRYQYLDGPNNRYLKDGNDDVFYAIGYPLTGKKVDTNKWEYVFTATAAYESNDKNSRYGNIRPGKYQVPVYGLGEYASDTPIYVEYVVEGVKLDGKNINSVVSAGDCIVNVNGVRPEFTMTLPFEVEAWIAVDKEPDVPVANKKKITSTDKYGNKTEQWYKLETTKKIKNTSLTMDLDSFFTLSDWKGNTVATDKASVKITPNAASGYTGKKVTRKFKINKKVVSKNQIHAYNEYRDLAIANGGNVKPLAGDLFVKVYDKYTKDKAPVVEIYQADDYGYIGNTIKSQKDYKFIEKLSGGISNNGIQIINGTLKVPNYEYKPSPLSVDKAKFDVYSTKGKKWELQLSDNVIYVSANGKEAKRHFELNKTGNSGTVVYNGRELMPQIMNLTVDGIPVVTNGKFQNKGVSCNVIYKNADKVGTATMRITLTKDSKGYVVGGTKDFKFKIVQQKGTGLVLEK